MHMIYTRNEKETKRMNITNNKQFVKYIILKKEKTFFTYTFKAKP